MICAMFISTVCTHLYKEHFSVNYTDTSHLDPFTVVLRLDHRL